MKVLIIEDTAFFRVSLRSMMQQWGFEVFEAENAKTGVTLFSQQLPDLVTLDLGLPDSDGLQVIGAIRRLNETVPILVITGRAQRDSIRAAITAGANDFLSKPITGDRLFEAIQKHTGLTIDDQFSEEMLIESFMLDDEPEEISID
jgi:DNA-binding response OmpR family regulator